MRRALLACESGAVRGHVVTLRTVAEALRGRFEFDAALYQLQFANEIEPLCASVFRGAGLHYDMSRRSGADSVRTATWGEFLGDLGFRDVAFLKRQIGWWCEVIKARRISLVIADYAPCALLAARCMGVASAVVGVGYGIAPSDLKEFPVFLPDMNERLYDEQDMVAAVNEAAAPLGLPPIRFLPQVYACDAQMPRTLPVLDPYDGLRKEPLIPPVADVATQVHEDGDEVFVYFSTTGCENIALVEAIAGLELPVRLFMPGIADELAKKFSRSGVKLEHAPVPVDLIAERSRMVIHAGQHGILCLALAAGLPQVAAPQHLEQLFHARRAAEKGVLAVAGKERNDADGFRSLVRLVYGDDGMKTRAIALSEQLLPGFQLDARTMIRDRLAHL